MEYKVGLKDVRASLRRQLSCQKVILRRNAEGIGDPIKECEQSGDINGLRNLIFFPARQAYLLHVLTR